MILSAAKAERPVQDDDGEEGHPFLTCFVTLVKFINGPWSNLWHHRQDVLYYVSNLLEFNLFHPIPNAIPNGIPT